MCSQGLLGDLLLRRGREGEGPTSKGDGRERRDGRGGEQIPPKVKVSRINRVDQAK